MQNEIRRYPVQHPLLKKYIKFFWELRIEHVRLNHNLIPQRNINLRINLSETPQYVYQNGKEHLMDNVFFSGLQDRFMNARLILKGNVDMLGICFLPEGFYPFLKIPVSEFKNQVVGYSDVGFKKAKKISEKLKEASGIEYRLNILENELLTMLDDTRHTPENFLQLFNALKKNDDLFQLSDFCQQNNIGIRILERMFNKYVGVSANTYTTLNRFHASLNQLLQSDYCKFSDVAYNNDYFDQMHFIREFKRYTGNTPKSFIHQNNSILQIGKLT